MSENKMSSTLRKSRKVHLGVAGLGLLAVSYFFLPQIKNVVKTKEPFRSVYQLYSGWRYPRKSPSDVRSGKGRLEVLLDYPMGICEDEAGNIYVSDRGGKKGGEFIWKIEPSGTAFVIAGSGTSRVATPDAALQFRFSSPEGLCLDANNNILVADSVDEIVLKIDGDGRISLFAGTGEDGFSGDFGPAREAALSSPYDIRLDSTGNIYIADYGNNRIRIVTPDGMISTVAGTGEAGYSGDGGPATEARLNGPYGIFIDREDNLLIADSQNHVIRKVGADRIITTIAGSGRPGYSGDGGPALAATLDTPQSLFVDENGRLYIGDEHNHCIRIVEQDGRIATLAGNGKPGFSGDGLPASSAQLDDPENLWVRKDGSILITDGNNARVRVINPDHVISTWAGTGPSPDHVAYNGNRARERGASLFALSQLAPKMPVSREPLAKLRLSVAQASARAQVAMRSQPKSSPR